MAVATRGRFGAAVLVAAACLLPPVGVRAQSPEAVAAKTLATVQGWLTGTFTNAEQVYFEDTAAGVKLPWVELVVTPADADGRFSYNLQVGEVTRAYSGLSWVVDGGRILLQQGKSTCAALERKGLAVAALAPTGAMGEATCADARPLVEAVDAIGPEGLVLRQAGSAAFDLRKARPFTCWMAIPTREKKPDGSIDWAYFPGQKLHDQGGRFWVETDEPQPQRFGFKLRKVVWPYGTNQSALTLYVYEGAEESRAVSYAWADLKASRIGINLRSMQGSCVRKDVQEQ